MADRVDQLSAPRRGSRASSSPLSDRAASPVPDIAREQALVERIRIAEKGASTCRRRTAELEMELKTLRAAQSESEGAVSFMTREEGNFYNEVAVLRRKRQRWHPDNVVDLMVTALKDIGGVTVLPDFLYDEAQTIGGEDIEKWLRSGGSIDAVRHALLQQLEAPPPDTPQSVPTDAARRWLVPCWLVEYAARVAGIGGPPRACAAAVGPAVPRAVGERRRLSAAGRSGRHVACRVRGPGLDVYERGQCRRASGQGKSARAACTGDVFAYVFEMRSDPEFKYRVSSPHGRLPLPGGSEVLVPRSGQEPSVEYIGLP